jgi:hypothetical protein
MGPSVRFAIVSVLLIATSVGIIQKQRSAASCPRHRRAAGVAAGVLAVGCLVAGLLLAGLAAYPWLSGRIP